MDLSVFKQELEQELQAILAYWMQYAIDDAQGGFYGKIDNNNNRYSHAPKGAVLNARILWTFSAAGILTGQKEYIEVATRAFRYICDHFVDKEFGGVYWTVSSNGRRLDTKKQIYALAFAIYGCSEYYRATQHEPARTLAIELFNTIQQYSYDAERSGYLEAFSQDWQPLADLRLSAKDANEKKTMNTHLHIVEAYASLYGIWPNHNLANLIYQLLQNFDGHIIDKRSGHLQLFFDEHWTVRSQTISFGHDIEASWLLPEAAKAIESNEMINRMEANAVKLACAAKEKGLDADGGLWYEYEPLHQQLVEEKHWWPQAEALVGFFNAWQLTGNEEFLNATFNNWSFIKQHIRDNRNGEWFWGVYKDYSLMPDQDKAGLWKCPYHNGRACLELIKRISNS
jgi:mannobiose 2-epimerase